MNALAALGGQSGLIGCVRQLGVRRMLQLRRARNWGWEGLLRGHVLTRVVQTVLDVGLFDAMQQRGAIDVTAFASEHGLDRRLLSAMCDYLAGRRVLRRGATEGCYELDKNGTFLMHSSALRGWMELANGYEDVLHAMPDLLARRRRYAAGDVQRDGRHVAVGSGRASTDFFFPLTTGRVQRAGYRRVLDIGCGDAAFLRYMCARLPGVTGVGIDRSPEAVVAANAAIAKDGLTRRVHVMCGDAMELERYRSEFSGVDAATSFFVLHELCGSGQQLLEPFLETYQRALPAAPLIAIEAIRPSVDQLRRRPGPASEYSLLHDLSGQRTIGRGAWRGVLQDAGFTNVTEEHLDFARASIYTAIPRRRPPLVNVVTVAAPVADIDVAAKLVAPAVPRGTAITLRRRGDRSYLRGAYEHLAHLAHCGPHPGPWWRTPPIESAVPGVGNVISGGGQS